jgi:hypothetical protein
VGCKGYGNVGGSWVGVVEVAFVLERKTVGSIDSEGNEFVEQSCKAGLTTDTM